MLLRNAWYVAAWTDEISAAKPFARGICNDPIVLFRDGSGRGAGGPLWNLTHLGYLHAKNIVAPGR